MWQRALPPLPGSIPGVDRELSYLRGAYRVDIGGSVGTSTKGEPNMRNRLTGRLSLLILSFAIAMIVFPAVAFAEPVAQDGTTGASMPTIQSDKADYAPGELVTLTGSNWQPGESVHINVNDDQGQTWSYDSNPDVQADANGNISHTFNLPSSFVATYKVTATGAQSGVATTSFTDGNLAFALATSGNAAPSNL